MSEASLEGLDKDDGDGDGPSPSPPAAAAAVDSSDGGRVRFLSFPATWDMQDKKRTVRKGGPWSGMWRKTLHRLCKTWKTRPGKAFDMKSTPFVSESALEQVCGMDPLGGTLWPQQSAEEFGEREPQYGGYLKERSDSTERLVGEEDPLSMKLAKLARLEESEDCTDDDKNKKIVGGLFRVAKRQRVTIVDEGAAKVLKEEHSENVVEPELLGCAKKILAAEQKTMEEVGKDNVLDACRTVGSIMDLIHERLIRKAIENRHSGDGESEVIDAKEVFEIAADVMLERESVKYPALALSEARARTAHVRSIIESLQVTDLTAMLNEVMNEPSLKKKTSDSVQVLPTFCESEDDEEVKEEQKPPHAMMRNRNHIKQHMPPRMLTQIRCHNMNSVFRAFEDTPEVWKVVRKRQKYALHLEALHRKKRAVTLWHSTRKRAERQKREANASTPPPDDNDDDP